MKGLYSYIHYELYYCDLLFEVKSIGETHVYTLGDRICFEWFGYH